MLKELNEWYEENGFGANVTVLEDRLNLFKNNFTEVDIRKEIENRRNLAKIIRNGRDMGYLFHNKHYDFNYQQNFVLNPPVVLTKVNN